MAYDMPAGVRISPTITAAAATRVAATRLRDSRTVSRSISHAWRLEVIVLVILKEPVHSILCIYISFCFMLYNLLIWSLSAAVCLL